MNRYFKVKKKEETTKAAILAQINQVAKNHSYRVNVQFYSSSICISSEHFMTTIHQDMETQQDMLCSGNLPTNLEDKLAAVTKMHEWEQEHIKVMTAIIKVLS